MDNKKVCAVLVTFNREKLLIECLEALENQNYPLDAIYLVDNASTDGTPNTLFDKKYINEIPPEISENSYETSSQKEDITINYIKMAKNTGGAGGFYEGIKRAYQEGYEWLWIMDDDSEPKFDALKELSHFFNEDNISALANLKIDLEPSIMDYDRGLFNFRDINIVKPISIPEDQHENIRSLEIDHASFVGLMVNRNAIKKIGFPKKDFFVHFDDLEYCIRLRKVGKILLITNSIITHKVAAKNDQIEKEILGLKVFRMPYEKVWITYYTMRNLMWIGTQYNTNKITFYMKSIIRWLKWLAGAFLLDEDKKLRRAYFITSAYYDGLKGNFDNEKPKRILYK